LTDIENMNKIIVYGIKNCNTVKSALEWLDKKNVAYDFHDYKKKGVTAQMLKTWSDQRGWEALVNKRGTTWRQLDADIQNSVKDVGSAIALMVDKPSVIKRPLIEGDGKVVALGFDEDSYSRIF
jgi:arsenate reductase